MTMMHRRFYPRDDHEPTLDERGQRLRFLDLVATRLLYLFTALFLVANSVIIVVRQDRSQQVLDKLVDCTTPRHSCYEQGRSQTREAVSRIEEIIIAANYCTRNEHNDTVVKVRICVVKLLGP